jgi:hypothetical protein
MKLFKNQGIFTLFCLIFILIFTNCKRKGESLLKEQPNEIPTDFAQFYEKFHSDSVYQMSHIQFPLDGYPTNADSVSIADKNFHWTADTWVMHTMKAFNDSLYTRTLEVPLAGIVNETVYQKNTPFGMVRRFFKRGDEWYLIFYSGMNSMKEN